MSKTKIKNVKKVVDIKKIFCYIINATHGSECKRQ